MRLLLDLQAIQGSSKARGIGRYSFEFAKALVRSAGDNEVWLGFSDLFPMPWERVAEISGNRVPPERVVSFSLNGQTREIEIANRSRAEAAEKVREAFLADLQPDVVHVSSLFEGFGEDIVTSIGSFEPALKSTVTLYDLIPLIREETYLYNDAVRQWYLRKIDWLRRAEGLLAISESAKREAVEHLGISEQRISIVYPGIDAYFRPVPVTSSERSRLHGTYGIDKPFVLHAAGADGRKNVDRLMEAFALLPAETRNSRQLVIVTTTDTQLHLQSLKVLSGLPLSPGQVVFTGHISDEDLRLLYTACEVFAFPSLHEGFGLPIVEAMACGAAVVASNSSSMPEAVGRSDALFDPNKTESIAQKLLEVLTSPAFALDLRAHGKAQVQRFTWERSAAVAWQAFQQLASQQALTSRPQIRSARAKPRLAYFSPLPPTRSGIADYSAELLPALAQHYEVEAIIDGERVEDDWIATHVPLRNVAWFEDNASRFDRVLYHMGNSAFHQYMLPLIERWPGVVVLHDFYLSGLFHYIGRTRDPGQWFRRLYDAHGLAAVRRYPKIEQSEIAALEFPCSLPVVDNALGIIVHSNHAVGMLRDLTGGRVGGSVVKVPFPRGTPGSRDRSEARARLRIDEGEFLVCSFGHLASTKLNHRLIDAWQLSRIGGRRASRLVFVGDLSGNPYAAQVWAQIRNGGQIDVTGYAQLSLYRDYLAACDVAVQLRTESRGETSASVFDCLAHGAPVIVNDHGSMAELPEDVALKIPDAFSDEDLAGALDQLANDRGLRSVLAQRGLEFARGEGNPAGVAERMRDAIENFQHTKNGRLARLIGAVASTDRLGEPDLVAAARAMGANRRSLRDHQLLLDVTNLAGERDKVDPRALAAKLIDQLTRTPASHRVEPVTAHGELRYARSFAARHFNLPAFGDDTPVDPMEGDRFLVVDVRPELPVDIFDLFRRRNVGILCVVQDCPPLADSTRVPSPAAKALTGWIEIVGRHADVALCTSRLVADDLYEWLNLVRPQRTSPLSIAVFSLGSDSRGEDGDQEPEVKGRGDDVPTPWSGRANGLLFAMEPQNAYRVWQVKETSR